MRVVDRAKQTAIEAQNSAERLPISLPLEPLKNDVTEIANEYQQLRLRLEQNLSAFEKLSEALRTLNSKLIELAANIHDLPEKVSDMAAKAKLYNQLKVDILQIRWLFAPTFS